VKFTQDCRHGPNEHSRVPSKVSFPQKRFSQIRVGLFAKTHDSMNRIFNTGLSQMDRLAMLDVTETGTSPCWFDTDAYKLACLLSCIDGQGQCLLKSGSTRYDMISRKHNH